VLFFKVTGVCNNELKLQSVVVNSPTPTWRNDLTEVNRKVNMGAAAKREDVMDGRFL